MALFILFTSEKLAAKLTFEFEVVAPFTGEIKITVGNVVSIIIVLFPVLKVFPPKSNIL